MAYIVGGLESEVVAMNSLTINLHLLMITFYRPSTERYKILIEEKAFPSDQYAIASQLQFHGYNPKDGIIQIKARKGEKTIRHEDILDIIEKEGDSIALILLGGINYYSGQLFNIKEITNIGKRKGCIVGFDLAHAAGNAELMLHNWNVDFAAWCNYKYLNTNILSASSLIPSLGIFKASGMTKLREKSLKMTGYLEFLLDDLNSNKIFEIITPRNEKERGCQLSLLFDSNGKEVFQQLNANNVICDYREPNLIRFAPVPLYNSFNEIYKFSEILKGLI